MKETGSVAEIVFLLGEQWESRCLNVGMSELRVKAITLFHRREISEEKAESCSPLGIMGSCYERVPHIPGHTQPVPAPADLMDQSQDFKMYCRGLCWKGPGRRLMAPGLLADAAGETRKAMLRHLPQQEHFSKSKLTQKNNIVNSPLPDTHPFSLNFYHNQMIKPIVVCSTFYELSPKMRPQTAYLVRMGRV